MATITQQADQTRILATNKLIRNTYTLLALALAVASVTATVAMSLNVPPVNILVLLIGFYGLFFGLMRMRNSGWALLLMFALSVFLGYTIAPILNLYLALPGGSDIVTMAFGTTALVFFGLSGYTLVSRKDFSFLGGFIFAGCIVLIVAVIAGFFFQMPALALAISVGFALLYSCVILYETSKLVHDPQANYIISAAMLFISIYNLFLSFLHIFGVFGNE